MRIILFLTLILTLIYPLSLLAADQVALNLEHGKYEIPYTYTIITPTQTSRFNVKQHPTHMFWVNEGDARIIFEGKIDGTPHKCETRTKLSSDYWYDIKVFPIYKQPTCRLDVLASKATTKLKKGIR